MLSKHKNNILTVPGSNPGREILFAVAVILSFIVTLAFACRWHGLHCIVLTQPVTSFTATSKHLFFLVSFSIKFLNLLIKKKLILIIYS